MARVLVADPIDELGVARLKAAGHHVDVRKGLSEDELCAIVGDYEAMVVRSETKVTERIIEHARKMVGIGRAGVGVDNIDVAAATQHGIAVVNSPTGNTIAAAEHAFALMISLARNIPQADASMRRSEWTRSRFMGVELRGKTLGIIGLGRVGSEVAHRARAFQMHVIAYDPYVSMERVRSLGVESVSMERLLRESDFISIHTPLTSGTKSLIGEPEFALLKEGVRIVNAARGGLVDERLLQEGLASGRIGGAALDVFPVEPPQDLPLREEQRAVLTPHLGASTEEAQVEVALEVVDQLLSVLSGGAAQYTINMPFVSQEVMEALGPYLPVATTMGRLAIQLADGQLETVAVRVAGEIAHHDIEILASAALVGVLSVATDMRINLVNAQAMAQERGIRIVEEKDPEGGEQYLNLVGVEVRSTAGTVYTAGTSVHGTVHLNRLNDFTLDMEPSAPYMLFTTHTDQPGMIGKVGTIAGEHDANISFMEVGRAAPRGAATMIVGFDDPVTDEMLRDIRAIEGMTTARLVTYETSEPVQPRLRGT